MSGLALVADWLAEVEGLLTHAVSGGVARPDPDLPADLTRAAERAQALGVAGAQARLSALAEALRARLAAPEGPLDPALPAALHGALAWARVARRALALQRVEAALEGAAGPAPAAPVAPTFSGDVWPVGLALDGDVAVIHGLTVPEGAPVLIRDRLTTRPGDPFGAPAISRLFQAAVDLRRTLNHLIRFEDHPIAGRAGDALALAPAFAAVPSRVPVTADFRPPTQGPGVALRPVMGPTGFAWHGPAGEVAVLDAPALALNAVKLGLRGPAAGWTAWLRPQGEGLLLMAAETPEDGRLFPTADPGAVRLRPAVLAAALAPRPGSPWAHGRVEAELAALGGDAPDLAGRAAPSTLADHWHAAQARRALGEAAAAPRAVVAEALALCLAPHDVARRRAVLGTDRAPPSPQAEWWAVALAADDADAHAVALGRLAQAWASPPAAPGPFTVAARGLLLWVQGGFDAQAEAGEFPDDDPAAPGAADAAWFEAWLQAFVEAGLPDPAAWLALGAAAGQRAGEGGLRLPEGLDPQLVFTAGLVAVAQGDAGAAADGLALLRRAGRAGLLVR